MDKKLTVITAGTPDWEPTSEELQQLVNTFQAATKNPAEAVVAARKGVQVRELVVPDDQAMIAVSNWLSDKDIEVCAHAFLNAYTKGLVEREETRNQRGVDAFRAALDKRLAGD